MIHGVVGRYESLDRQTPHEYPLVLMHPLPIYRKDREHASNIFNKSPPFFALGCFSLGFSLFFTVHIFLAPLPSPHSLARLIIFAPFCIEQVFFASQNCFSSHNCLRTRFVSLSCFNAATFSLNGTEE